MSEPTEAYESSYHFTILQLDISDMMRHIHHDLDNYGMDMSKELNEALKTAEKALRMANKQMKKERKDV